MNLSRLHMLLGLLILVCCRPSRAQDPVHVMKIGIGNPQQENNFACALFEALENRAEALSIGQLQEQLCPQVMGISSMTMISMVQAGVVQARDSADGYLATIFPSIQVLPIPYLFADRQVAWKVLDGPFGQRLIKEMASQTGLRLLCWLQSIPLRLGCLWFLQHKSFPLPCLAEAQPVLPSGRMKATFPAPNRLAS